MEINISHVNDYLYLLTLIELDILKDNTALSKSEYMAETNKYNNYWTNNVSYIKNEISKKELLVSKLTEEYKNSIYTKDNTKIFNTDDDMDDDIRI